jgi:hypothetical protein
MRRQEGFAGQRIQVLPRPRVAQALAQSLTRILLVTDCGYFPKASEHFMRRDHGAQGAVVLVCVGGAGFVSVEGRTHAVCPGQVAVIPPHVAHSYGANADNPWTIWWMHVSGSGVPDLLAAARVSAAAPVVKVGGGESSQLSRLVDEALWYLERADSDMSLSGASGAAWHALTLLHSNRLFGDPDDPLQ